MRQYFSLHCQLSKCFLSVEINLETAIEQKLSKYRISSRGISGVEFHCRQTIVIAVHISFTSLLNGYRGYCWCVGSSVASSGGFESNFGRGCVGLVGPQSFRVRKKGRGWNFGVGETYDFKNFCYDSMKFYRFKLRF